MSFLFTDVSFEAIAGATAQALQTRVRRLLALQVAAGVAIPNYVFDVAGTGEGGLFVATWNWIPAGDAVPGIDMVVDADSVFFAVEGVGGTNLEAIDAPGAQNELAVQLQAAIQAYLTSTEGAFVDVDIYKTGRAGAGERRFIAWALGTQIAAPPP